MKPRYLTSLFHSPVLISSASLLIAPSLHAATLNSSDTFGNSSFAAAGNWNPSAAPSDGNDYFVTNGLTLRTAANGTNAIFAGESLTLGDNTTTGSLTFKNNNGVTITVNNLILNNGEISNSGDSNGSATTITLAGGVTLSPSSVANRINTFGNTRAIIVTAPISGSGALEIKGGGPVTLSGSNSYGGGTTVTAGTLNINDDAALGAVPGSPATNLTFTGSATLFTGVPSVSLDANRNIQINTGATVTFNAGGASNVLTINGAVTNNGSFTFATSSTNAATGTVVLAGSNNFAASTINLGGATDKGGGILRLANSNALGSNAVTISSVNANSNWVGAVELSGGITIGSNVTLNMSGHNQGGTGADNLRNVSGNNAFNGAINITQTGGAYQIDSAEAGSTLTLGGNITNTLNSARTLNFIGDGDTLASGVLAATGGASSLLNVVKSGAGTLTLSGANTYTGTTTVNAGTLAVNGTALPDATKLVVNGGVVAPTGTEVVDTLFFGAVQQASGTWGATGSGATHIDDTHFTGTGVVSVTTGGGYSSWATANAGGQDSNLDYDNDGVKNGVEYFMGATGSTFTANPGIVNGKVTWPKDPAFSGTYTVQTSPDLGIWTNVSSTVVGNTVEYTVPTGQDKVFVRLNVTPN